MIPQAKRDAYLRGKVRAETIKDCIDRLMKVISDIPTRQQVSEELGKMLDSENQFIALHAREIADIVAG